MFRGLRQEGRRLSTWRGFVRSFIHSLGTVLWSVGQLLFRQAYATPRRPKLELVHRLDEVVRRERRGVRTTNLPRAFYVYCWQRTTAARQTGKLTTVYYYHYCYCDWCYNNERIRILYSGKPLVRLCPLRTFVDWWAPLLGAAADLGQTPHPE